MNEREEIAEQHCSIIQAAVPKAKQNMKWSAPNFSVDGQDLLTLNLSPRYPVRIVFHRGAKAVDTKTGKRMIEDGRSLLTWATDQRAYASFATMTALAENARWLSRLKARIRFSRRNAATYRCDVCQRVVQLKVCDTSATRNIPKDMSIGTLSKRLLDETQQFPRLQRTQNTGEVK